MTDEELIARLRVNDPVCEEHFTANIAADRFEALVKERDEAINQLDSARHSVDVLEKWVAHFMSRAERLEAALRNIAEGNLGDDPWQANYLKIKDVARAALKGDDHE